MMVVRKCDVVVKKWVVGAKKHDGPIVVVKKQVMVVKKKKVDAKNAGGYEKNAVPHTSDRAGLGRPQVGSGLGQVRHLGPRPHEGRARSALGPTRAGPALVQCMQPYMKSPLHPSITLLYLFPIPILLHPLFHHIHLIQCHHLPHHLPLSLPLPSLLLHPYLHPTFVPLRH